MKKISKIILVIISALIITTIGSLGAISIRNHVAASMIESNMQCNFMNCKNGNCSNCNNNTFSNNTKKCSKCSYKN